jgi:hypothetical protein
MHNFEVQPNFLISSVISKEKFCFLRNKFSKEERREKREERRRVQVLRLTGVCSTFGIEEKLFDDLQKL